MNKMKYPFILLTGMLFMASCSNTRHLPKGEILYTGARVDVTGPSLTVRERKTLREDLKGLTRPRPNIKFLGFRVKLAMYNLFHKKKPNSFFGRIRDKFGEPPVLLSELDLEYNTKVLQNHLENKGYFHAQVKGDTIVRRKRAVARYKAQTGNQYSINNIVFPSDTSDLSLALAQASAQSLLKKGDPFDIDVIKAERTRLDAIVKEKGFYFFSPDYLLIKTDSTIGNNQVDMYVVVKPETPAPARWIHHINDVYIYSGYSLNTARIDTVKSNATYYKGYTIIDRVKRFKPYLFEETMQFRPGEVYNRTDHNRTLNRLVNLNLFKFVKNRFELVNVDSPKLDVFYYLTPLPKKSIRGEVTAISRSNNLNGSQFNISWLNRNMFRAGAQFNLSAYVGTDVQFSGAFKGYNTYRTGAEAAYVIPRFIIPFMHLSKKSAFAPRTNIRLGYDILQRIKLYTLNSYRFEYGYTWKENIQKQHELFPISITYVQPLNVTKDYDTLKLRNPALQRAIDPQFILGSRYEYIYNQLANNIQPLNAYYFNGVVDLSGNIAGLITGANVKKGDTALIRNTPFSQYIKLEADARYYRKIGLRSTWANRIDVGLGLPYGNSVEIPYIKQFFVGGNNSLRGFRSRSVGPGTYHYIDTVRNVIPDQTGDIKLELNTEFRPHISGPLYGAVFIDAGNIWLKNDTMYTQKPGSKFTGKFLSQLALDAGIGIRLDATIFVIRFDIGIPLRKPWEKNPWVMKQISWNPQWRRENIIYNLAIGYPF